MKPNKQALCDAYAQWLMDNDISFIEHANGQYNIYNNISSKTVGTLWATKHKFWKTGAPSAIVGEARVKQIILEETILC